MPGRSRCGDARRSSRGGGAGTTRRRSSCGDAPAAGRSRPGEAALPEPTQRGGPPAAARSRCGEAELPRRCTRGESEVPAQAPDPWRRWPLRLEPASSSAGREAAGARQGERLPAGSGRDGREGRRRCTDGGTGRRRGGESEERGATFGEAVGEHDVWVPDVFTVQYPEDVNRSPVCILLLEIALPPPIPNGNSKKHFFFTTTGRISMSSSRCCGASALPRPMPV